MESFVDLPVELNGAAVKAAIYADMEEKFPGWRPKPGKPETRLIDSMSDRLHVPLGQLAADAAAELFYSFGEKIAGVQPIGAVAATVKSTWTVKDNAGYEIPAGTQVKVAKTGDTSEGFRVVNTIVIPKGDDATDEGAVVLEAIEPGAQANDLDGDVSPEDTLNFILPGGIELVDESSGGRNAEEPAEYLNRLAETMETLAPRPILPRDVEILARNVPGVFRALALDLFDPESDDPEDPETWVSERHVSVAVADEAGQPCSEAVKEAVKADLASKREANFKFFVLDPDYTPVAVKVKAVARDGFDQVAEKEKLAAALANFLDPGIFGQDPNAASRRTWNRETVVRYQDVVTVVNNQPGIDHYTELKIGKEGGALEEKDVPLEGAAPLTEAGEIEVG